MIVSSVQREVV